MSTQADTESAAIAKERLELETMADVELEELASMYRQRGLSPELAREVAVELTAGDALAAHAEIELGIDPYERSNPWQAAFTSMLSFVWGLCCRCWRSRCRRWAPASRSRWPPSPPR